MNVSKYERIFARNCSLRELTGRKHQDLVKSFLTNNHQQGWARGNRVAYGLFHGGQLVQLMTFGKPRFNRNFEWEIIRECSKKGTQIIGGSSRLFEKFVTDIAPLSVVVYTSIKDKHLLSHSNHYVKHLGFTEYAKSKPIKEIFFTSREWPREDNYGQSYAASAVHRIGPDRLLGTKLGFESGTNREIMLSLGYEEQRFESISPQVDAWFSNRAQPRSSTALGYLYRVDCSCGASYPGMGSVPLVKQRYSTPIRISRSRMHPAGLTARANCIRAVSLNSLLERSFSFSIRT